MRDIFTEIFENQPLDPMEAARRGMRPPLRKRFYQRARRRRGGEGGFAVLLDGKPVRTPARRPLAAPSRALARGDRRGMERAGRVIDPARMPLTRLANAIIDAVADAPAAVAAEIEKYLGTDLLLLSRRGAGGPGRARRRAPWDPVLAWAREALGARFVLVAGRHARAAAGAKPSPPRARRSPQRTRGGSARWRRSPR